MAWIWRHRGKLARQLGTIFDAVGEAKTSLSYFLKFEQYLMIWQNAIIKNKNEYELREMSRLLSAKNGDKWQYRSLSIQWDATFRRTHLTYVFWK
jgi:hypothetical protein